MKRSNKILAISLGLSFVLNNACFLQDYSSKAVAADNSAYRNVSNVIQADIKSQRVPAGTTFRLRMETPVNSYNTTKGDTFRATLTEDIRIGTKVIIPEGTITRGTAGDVKKNGYLSRGGWLTLQFDHIVTPMGKQVPVNVNIINSKYLTQKGILAAGGGYFSAVNAGVEKGTDFLADSANYGIKLGQSFWKGYPLILTVPVGTGVGLLGAGGIFVADSVTALFKKGENVRINPNDIIEVVLKEPIDVPLN